MINVLIVTDVRLWREGLTRVLADRPLLRVVGAMATGVEMIKECTRLCPDLVLLDMTISDAVSTVQSLGRTCSTTGVIGLSVEEAEEDVIRCLEAGIRGYVPRDGSIEDLIATIESVTRGEMVCPPRITAALARRVSVLIGAHSESLGELSNRQQEVTALVHQGLSNKQIAQRLRITVATVKNHVHSVLRKLDVRTRREAGRRFRQLRPM